MEFTKTITLNKGDIVEALTEDGWESGTVENIKDNKILIHLDFINETREFTIDLIRK